MIFCSRKRGQIWVETVLYTLIALALIGLVLAFAKPRIEEAQDKALIEQSIDVLDEIDFKARTIGGPGNQRVIFLKLSKGTLYVDGENDLIYFELESRHEFSEDGQQIKRGNIDLLTERSEGKYKVTLTQNYAGKYNITYDGIDQMGMMPRATSPYKILISNRGLSGENGLSTINIVIGN